MKKSIIIVLLCFCQIAFAQNPFYRYQGQIINLQTDSAAFVVFNSNTIMGGGNSLLNSNLAIKSTQYLSANSLLVELKPNTSRQVFEATQQNLKTSHPPYSFLRLTSIKTSKYIPQIKLSFL